MPTQIGIKSGRADQPGKACSDASNVSNQPRHIVEEDTSFFSPTPRFSYSHNGRTCPTLQSDANLLALLISEEEGGQKNLGSGILCNLV